MGDDRFAQLTQRQLECLRLLRRKGTIKGVASALLISPSTVEFHLKVARKLLGVTDSWTASELVLEHLGATYGNSGKHPEAVAATVEAAATGTGTDDRSEGLDDGDTARADERIEPSQPQRIPTPVALFPPIGRPPNDLSIQARFGLIATAALLSIGAVTILFALVYMMGRLLVELNRHGG